MWLRDTGPCHTGGAILAQFAASFSSVVRAHVLGVITLCAGNRIKLGLIRELINN